MAATGHSTIDAQCVCALLVPRVDRPRPRLDEPEPRMDRGYACVCRDWMRPAIWKQEAEWKEKEG